MIRSIGLIVGHGYVKVACGTARHVFPAVFAPVQGGEYTSVTGTGAKGITLNGSTWLVGDEALMFAQNRIISILDRSRYTSDGFAAMAKHALNLVAEPGDTVRILTGMPQAWYSDTQSRQALETTIQYAASAWKNTQVTVAPEAAGVYYSYVFENGSLDPARMQGDIGVIDAGYRDINIALFRNGRYVAGESIPGGMADGLAQVRQTICQTYHLEMSLHDVDRVVRVGHLVVDGKKAPLPDNTAQMLKRSLEAVRAAGRTLYPNGGRTLTRVLLGGGGAFALQAGVTDTWTQTYVLPNPHLAGAVGFSFAQAAQKG